jgi:hypothetical protein
MKVSTLISDLQQMQAEVGDVEVIISDNYQGTWYHGNYRIITGNNSYGDTFIDIGIEGHLSDGYATKAS